MARIQIKSKMMDVDLTIDSVNEFGAVGFVLALVKAASELEAMMSTGHFYVLSTIEREE